MFVPDIADQQRMTDVLAAHTEPLGLGPLDGPCRLLDAQIRHSHRPASSRCRGWATYSVPVADGSPALLYVRGYPDGTTDAAWRDLVAAGRAGGATRIGDLIVWRFPDDPALPALSVLVDPARIVDRLPKQCEPARITPEDLEVEVVRYQPETSATVRYRLTAGEAPTEVYAKAADDDPTETSRLHDRLWDLAVQQSGLRIARPLGSEPTLRVRWTLGVSGRSIADRPDPGAMAAIAAEIAVAVAELHGCGVRAPHEIRAGDCLAEGRKKAAKLAEALPRCQSLLAAIAPADEDFGRAAAPALVHGDLHLAQFVRGPDGPVLVDLDTIANGDPELDLAELVVDVVLRSPPDDAVDAFVSALLETYEQHGRPVRSRLLRALADAEFLTRCHRHLRRRAPGWEIDLERSLERHAVLTAGVPG